MLPLSLKTQAVRYWGMSPLRGVNPKLQSRESSSKERDYRKALSRVTSGSVAFHNNEAISQYPPFFG